MKIKEKTTGRLWIILLFASVTIIFSMKLILAYNSISANPAVFGHSVDEMNWSATIRTNITAEGLCFNNSGTMSCIKDWISCGGSLWTQTGVNLNYSRGNVGIGTSSPGKNLEIASSLEPTIRLNKTGVAACDIRWDGSRLAIANGKVGIGTISPVQKLDVIGNVNATAICLGGVCKTSWPTCPTCASCSSCCPTCASCSSCCPTCPSCKSCCPACPACNSCCPSSYSWWMTCDAGGSGSCCFDCGAGNSVTQCNGGGSYGVSGTKCCSSTAFGHAQTWGSCTHYYH